jgi:hypothetical protein
MCVAALATCLGCERERSVELERYRFSIPDGWTAQTSVDGLRHVLVLTDPAHVIACEVMIVRDGRLFRTDDSRALVGDGRRAFGDEGNERISIAVGSVEMEGVRMRGAVPRESWSLGGTGPARIEMIAAAEGPELFALLLAAREERGFGPERERCLALIQNARER